MPIPRRPSAGTPAPAARIRAGVTATKTADAGPSPARGGAFRFTRLPRDSGPRQAAHGATSRHRAESVVRGGAKRRPADDPASLAASRPVRQRLRWLPIRRLRLLRRNPQYLSPHELSALQASIQRDGFLAPVLCRPHPDGGYELLSGNHRVIAAQCAGLTHVPALLAPLTDAQATRAAVNLNTVHGEPPAELLAPFLACLDDQTLPTVHLPDALRRAVLNLDHSLAEAFAALQPPARWNRPSPRTPLPRRHADTSSSDTTCG